MVEDEPDRLSGSFAAGPRVLISQEALDGTGLLAPGSRVTRRLLFKLQPTCVGKAASDAQVADLRTQLETILPQAQVSDYREANPAITQALDGATGLLSLMSLVALVLGAVGVAMAMRAHLQQRLDSIAIMKSLGAGSSQIMRIYLLQTLLLGLGGGVLGCGAGDRGAAYASALSGEAAAPDAGAAAGATRRLLGLGAGLLTTLLFTLPPLLDIRNVRPILILRRAVESEDRRCLHARRKHLRGSGLQMAATALILVGLVVLAATVADSRQVGGCLRRGCCLALLVLLGAAALTLSCC